MTAFRRPPIISEQPNSWLRATNLGWFEEVVVRGGLGANPVEHGSQRYRQLGAESGFAASHSSRQVRPIPNLGRD